MYVYKSSELSDITRLWRRQDENNPGLNQGLNQGLNNQGFNYLTRIPLSQFLFATSGASGNFAKFKRMPIFNNFGKELTAFELSFYLFKCLKFCNPVLSILVFIVLRVCFRVIHFWNPRILFLK